MIKYTFPIRYLLFSWLLLVMIGLQPILGQKEYKTYTHVHEENQLVKKGISVYFLNDKLEFNHPWLDSMTVYNMDSVVFVEEMPELYEIYGTPVSLNFQLQEDSIPLKYKSPEYYVIFSAYHTLKALEFYKQAFGNLLDFRDEGEFKHIKVYLGEFINCNPGEYVFNPVSEISPTTIYHEVGHRAFCQLDDTIPVGDVSALLHNGLLEYYTASIADYPVVGEGFLPEMLTRDLSEPVHYPEDLHYYQDFMRDFYASYKDTLSAGEATKQLLELNRQRAERCTEKILMTHQSGLLIAHPLWQIREEIGAERMDSLLAETLKILPSTLKLREYYYKGEVKQEQETAQWYDLLYALNMVDKRTYKGKHSTVIMKYFSETGYDTRLVRYPKPEDSQSTRFPLMNKKILVTAPAHYAPRFADILTESGAKPVMLPSIETVFNPDTKPIDNILENPEKYDWVVLPSRKAIESFFRRAEDKNTAPEVLNSLKFLAIGKDIDFLRSEYNTEVSFIPEEPSPKGITQAFSEMENIQNQSVAVIAPKVVGLEEPDVIPDFISGLKKIEMKPIKIEGYITQPADSAKYSKELSFIREKKLDVIAFTSTGEIEALIKMLGDVKWLNQNTVACFGPYTAANARKLGVKVDFTGREFHSFEDYVKGITQYLKAQQNKN